MTDTSIARLSCVPALSLVLAFVFAGATAATDPDPEQDLEVLLLLYRPGCQFNDYHFVVANSSTTYDYLVSRRGEATTYNGPEECWSGEDCLRSYDLEPDKVVPASDCIKGSPVWPGFPVCDYDCTDCDDAQECPCTPGVGCDDPCGESPPDCSDACGDPMECPCTPPVGCVDLCDPPARCDNPQVRCDQTFPDCQCPPAPAACYCAWCATINDPELRVTAYRSKCPTGQNCQVWKAYDPVLVICSGINLAGTPELPGVRTPFCPFESQCIGGVTSDPCPDL